MEAQVNQKDGPIRTIDTAVKAGIAQGKKFELYYVTLMKKAGMLPLYIPPPQFFAQFGEILFVIMNTI